MSTKNILKTLALALLLVPACSKSEKANDQKGYTLPVTINATREGVDATKATFDDGTKKLSFSTGDKLFVWGTHATAGQFAGALNWVSGGTFNGSITTQNEFSGTADDLFTAATGINAYLLPYGYESKGFLTVFDYDTPAKFDDEIRVNYGKAFALTKAAGVEQLSHESTTTYSGGFALVPRSAILNCTIGNLPAGTSIGVHFSDGYDPVNESVTTDASGNAAFVVGVLRNTNFNSCTLRMDGVDITLASSSKTLTAGSIYNVTRTAVYAKGDVISAKMGGYNCAKVYTSPTAGFYIMCTDESTNKYLWADACAVSEDAGGYTFKCGAKEEWEAIMDACGAPEGYNCINTKCDGVGVTGWTPMADTYWTSSQNTEPGLGQYRYWGVRSDDWGLTDADNLKLIRLISAFSGGPQPYDSPFGNELSI